MTKIETNVGDNEWERFLDNYNTASIYHTPQWKDFLEKTFNYEPHYLFAKDKNDNITGLLSLFYVKSKLTGNRLCSVPFSHICGYIGSEHSKDGLINKGIDLFLKTDANYFEIRDLVNSNGFCDQNLFSTQILELSSNIDETWKKLSKGTRNSTKKSKNSGIYVYSTKNIEDLKQFYELNCITKKRIGVPCHPWNFYENMFKSLNERVSLYVAKYSDEIVAGGIFIYFGDTVIYGYAASNPRYLNIRPNNALTWKSIEDACVNGYHYFDFGRTSYDNKGLIEYKRRWGTVEKKLYYSYYPYNPESLTGNRENIKYKYGTKVIQKMPMSVYKKFSDSMFQHFG
ncbi:Lipid II:glycine glycyltransferase [Candidatus Methanomarinus sp.]|nr:Lipid II:glycine glycyltransferase [ANME-2 cluster archaeon]